MQYEREIYALGDGQHGGCLLQKRRWRTRRGRRNNECKTSKRKETSSGEKREGEREKGDGSLDGLKPKQEANPILQRLLN